MTNTAALTISREAGDKAKGFRLQKLRAAKLILEAMENHQQAMIYTAIEVVEDVTVTVSSNSGTQDYFEEDKNFDSATNFTIFSSPVLNTLVSFFDIYTNQWKNSSNVVLGFYTTAGIGKERKSELENGEKIALPKESILKLMQEKKVEASVATEVKKILVEEYRKQYASKTTPGYLKTLEDCTPSDFLTFLAAIKWHFCDEDEIALKQSVLRQIGASSSFSFKVANKEEIILALMLEKIDERQNWPNFSTRFLTSSDVKLIFKEAESEESVLLDPTWADLKKLELEIKDKRNLHEKVSSVCADVSVARIRMMARLACRSKNEQLNGNKSFLALQYRVYEACEEHLCSSSYSPPQSAVDFEALVQLLNAKALAAVNELKTDYTYSISNGETIKGIVMDLADRCFIAFEKC
jgi:hypothetical protein